MLFCASEVIALEWSMFTNSFIRNYLNINESYKKDENCLKSDLRVKLYWQEQHDTQSRIQTFFNWGGGGGGGGGETLEIK